jgi:uncharacterized protein (TIGR00255 family)
VASVHSMTAFSRKEVRHDWGTLSCEIRSVNHRYLETAFRMPEALRCVEPQLREKIRKPLSRGKVDCNFQLQLDSAQHSQVEIDEQVMEQYLHAINRINERTGNPVPATGQELLFKPGVMRQQHLDNDILVQATSALFDETLADHLAHREREGKALAVLIQERLDKIAATVVQLRPMIPALVQQQKEKLHHRLAEIKGQLDEGRIEQEIALLAQRIDVDEELDRLNTHLQEVKRALKEGGGVGRRLDFLMQELNREANTLSSKSMASDTTLLAVDMKVLIEQMREQIQNIE